MDNNKHLGTRLILKHGQERRFDSFKNIPYEINWNILIFGNLKHDLWENEAHSNNAECVDLVGWVDF